MRILFAAIFVVLIFITNSCDIQRILTIKNSTDGTIYYSFQIKDENGENKIESIELPIQETGQNQISYLFGFGDVWSDKNILSYIAMSFS
ncbi:hypothetical protein MM239_11255 [Belliella sp. DSM 111904]|uniref:Uncharacterized protein n=1 Tax=Belliella filtrata TaxID=2923435 RepID=A0ABS9V0N7_9BACT|nr:hypothetical protein [Belliella filtrata]MCH7409972.1 hypothetical protein [Belliella filtrata]